MSAEEFSQRDLVAICIPCGDQVNTAFCMSLAAATYSTRFPLVIITGRSSGITFARNQCLEAVEEVERTQDKPVKWLMWFDSDINFPADIVTLLLSRKKQIVGASYCRRTPPHDILMRPLGGFPNDEPRRDFYIPSTGLVEVEGLPTGCLLTHRDVFKDLKKPYWRFLDNEETGKTMGEDYVFCKMAREAGYNIWLDVDATKQIAHMGPSYIKVEDYYPQFGKSSIEQVPRAGLMVPPGASVPKSLIGIRPNGAG